MTITIRPEDERTIVDAIRSGSYETPDDVIGRALQLLRSEDEWLSENKSAIDEKIERAMAQFERGEFFSAEESRADMGRRKAEWLRERRG